MVQTIICREKESQREGLGKRAPNQPVRASTGIGCNDELSIGRFKNSGENNMPRVPEIKRWCTIAYRCRDGVKCKLLLIFIVVNSSDIEQIKKGEIEVLVESIFMSQFPLMFVGRRSRTFFSFFSSLLWETPIVQSETSVGFNSTASSFFDTNCCSLDSLSTTHKTHNSFN